MLIERNEGILERSLVSGKLFIINGLINKKKKNINLYLYYFY